MLSPPYARPLTGSAEDYDALFHKLDLPRFLLIMRGGAGDALARERRLERAIGVIYRPETERISHYFQADLARQFDAVIHIDETQALTPLERTAQWQADEPPETYPSAM
jgi:erythromycin esterase-like protein